MSPSDQPEVRWLRNLAAAVPHLLQEKSPRAYWSQRVGGLPAAATALETSTSATATRVRKLVAWFEHENYFAQRLGFDCVDGYGELDATPESELERRVGKPALWSSDPESWAPDDLWDFIEIFHDLAARPTRSSLHTWNECGWHPLRFSRASGQALYRWKMNELLATTAFDLRLADDGEDVGRLVRASSGPLAELVSDVLVAAPLDEVNHAIALFRSRDGGRPEKRSAIVALARILEERRSLLKAELFKADEGALFDIANNFDVRHSNRKQKTQYDDAFLDWVFYWYLATIQLTDALLARQDRPVT